MRLISSWSYLIRFNNKNGTQKFKFCTENFTRLAPSS